MWYHSFSSQPVFFTTTNSRCGCNNCHWNSGVVTMSNNSCNNCGWNTGLVTTSTNSCNRCRCNSCGCNNWDDSTVMFF